MKERYDVGLAILVCIRRCVNFWGQIIIAVYVRGRCAMIRQLFQVVADLEREPTNLAFNLFESYNAGGKDA